MAEAERDGDVQDMTPSTRYGTLTYEKTFRIWELHSTNLEDALWLSWFWQLPLYQSSGPAEDWVLVENPTQRQFPERHPREGI